LSVFRILCEIIRVSLFPFSNRLSCTSGFLQQVKEDHYEYRRKDFQVFIIVLLFIIVSLCDINRMHKLQEACYRKETARCGEVP